MFLHLFAYVTCMWGPGKRKGLKALPTSYPPLSYMWGQVKACRVNKDMPNGPICQFIAGFVFLVHDSVVFELWMCGLFVLHLYSRKKDCMHIRRHLPWDLFVTFLRQRDEATLALQPNALVPSPRSRATPTSRGTHGQGQCTLHPTRRWLARTRTCG